jgi:hypothetical protein
MNARTLIALLLAATGATGCLVDNNASVLIAASCFPPTPGTGGTCAFAATCDAVWLGNLDVDVAASPVGGTPLKWPLQMENQRPDNSARDGGTNTASAWVTGYKLKYTSAAVAIPGITLDWSSQRILPGGTIVEVVPLIPSAVRSFLLGVPSPTELLVEVRATGYYGDGSTFETGPFSLVVSVRNGGYVPGTCTAPAVYEICPQPGQSGVGACI